jgi:translation initiation factor 1
MSKKDDFKNRVVFSTNPSFKQEEEEIVHQTPASKQQTLYVSIERFKGGKMATIVENFTGNLKDLESLGKELKSKCGGGGTVKDGIILIQGEHRDRVISILNALGFKTKKKGG